MSEPERLDPRRTPKRRSVFDPIGRIMDTVVPSVTDAVDIDDMVRRVDVDGLLHRVDVDALVQRIDADALLARLDVDALMARVDVDALVRRVDVEALLGRVDVDALMARIDVNALMARVDVDAVVRRVDADALMARVDVDAVVRRVDVNAILDRVDVDPLMARVDVDAIVDRVDVDKIMQRADIAGVVAQSTRGITARTLDLARRQVAGVDEIITRVAARLVRRDSSLDPDGPTALQADLDTAQQAPSITGHYAGPVARAAALILDWVTMLFLFGIGTAVGSWTIDLLVGDSDRAWGLSNRWSTTLLIAWAFTYFVVPLALTGRTFGKAVVGLRVVTGDGRPLPAARVVVRVVLLPVSFALFGLGLVGAVIGQRRRTLPDVVASSAVVIDWGDRPASIPNPLNNWLSQRAQRSRSGQ